MSLGKRGWLGVGVGGAVLTALFSGAWIYHQKGGGDDITFNAAPLTSVASDPVKATPAAPVEILAGGNDSPSPTPIPTPIPQQKILVHIAGAVKNPGVYELKPGDRIQAAIHAAGGFLPDADQETLNLADYARDADKYTVPRKAQTAALSPAPAPPVVHSDRVPAAVAALTPAPGRVLGNKPSAAQTGDTTPKEGAHPAKFKNPGDGVINLNTASAEELQKLPGIGPAMAERILDYRKQIGKFADVTQIRDVKGIGEKKFEKMKPFLTVQ